FVTHDQEEAMVLSDRIAVIRSGQLQQVGPPMEVYREPKNLFVASFIGSPAMNIVELEAGVADGAIAGTVAGQTVSLPPAAGARRRRPRVAGLFRRPRAIVRPHRRRSTLIRTPFDNEGDSVDEACEDGRDRRGDLGREPCRGAVDPSGRGARLDLRSERRAGE